MVGCLKRLYCLLSCLRLRPTKVKEEEPQRHELINVIQADANITCFREVVVYRYVEHWHLFFNLSRHAQNETRNLQLPKPQMSSCIVVLTFGSETLSLPFATPRASHCFNNEPRRLTILTKVKGQRADQRARNCFAFLSTSGFALS